MAKKESQTESGQFAQCLELSSYQGSDGKTHETCLMRLDNSESKDFEVPVSKYFKPVKNHYYVPEVDVITVAKVSERTGKPYTKAQVVVRWLEADSEPLA